MPTSGAPEAKPDARRKLRKIGGLIAGAAALGTVLAGLTGYWTTYRTVTREILAPAKLAPAEAARLSIVVLPFTNLSGDPNQDYFADGITEDLTTDLSRIRNSFVIARNTAFSYKGKNIDAKEIGKELDVRYVLEGSVRRDQDRVRVNAQLIDAHGGAHLWADQFDTTRADLLGVNVQLIDAHIGAHLWADHFDTARADLLQMQDEIVARLANALGFELLKAETQRSAHSTNPDAMDLAMRCNTVVRNAGYFGKEAEAGYRLCEQALDSDPNNVDALLTFSIKFWLPVQIGRSADPQADLKRADELVSRALAVDANYWRSHNFKGQVLRAERRLDDAIAEYERALALNANYLDALANLGQTYAELGQPEKAIEFVDNAIRLSPYDSSLSFWYGTKSFAYLALQQYDQAIKSARRSIAINPNYAYMYGALATAFALTGHDAEARDAWRRQRDLEHLDGAITFGETAQAQDKDTERPTVKVGDRWMFVLRSTSGAKLEYAWVVTSVSPTGIEGTENGQPLALTPDLNIIKSPQEENSDDRLLSFPLEVDKQWSYVNDYVRNNMIFGTLQGGSKGDAAVLGYEKVRVPAGEFDAFKLEARGAIWESPQAGGPGAFYVTYWYAPTVRAIVKKVLQITGVPIYTTELVEFQLQP